MSLKTHLMTSVALLTIATGAAMAENHTGGSGSMESTVTTPGYPTGWNDDLDRTYAGIADRPVAELIGMNVITDRGDDVGEVDNFIIMDGRLQAVVGVGGFLGLGEHEVALPLDELAFDGSRIIISYSEEELEAMPEYTEELSEFALNDSDTFRTRSETVDMADVAEPIDTDMESAADQSDEMAATQLEVTPGDTAEEELTAAREGTVQQEAEELAAATEQEAEELAAETEQNVAELGADIEEGAEATAQMAENAADATGNAIEEGAAEATQMAENAGEATMNAAEEAGDEIAQAADATGDAIQNGAAATAAWFAQLDEEFAAIADMEINDLEGVDVATANGDVIGEVDNIGTHNGELVAIVGIGGFLGLGEHDVALDVAQLNWDGEKFVIDGYTEEELKAMPEVDIDGVELLDDDTTLRAHSTM